MLELMKGLLIEEEGQGMTEYGLILGLIAIAAVAALGFLSDDIRATFEDIADQLPGTGTETPTQ
ncbi:Flp family type IVb pilin [Domibacillus sp. PGB-M46]|uniref:Flp family type IVb pilin n=1 Tax=Domibacillus sp. PGB-M46 TaxID=2910255 RepID=UPI001F587B45|nr:Flp family type IVb pilin [Domibacillus sp. PGB-M46]MCI2257072.1 Flp family type IVb pilin [Domibacillus sp. PGB-M46]